MSLAKQKPVLITGHGKTMIFDSIDDLLQSKTFCKLFPYRKKFERMMKKSREINGYVFELSGDVSHE